MLVSSPSSRALFALEWPIVASIGTQYIAMAARVQLEMLFFIQSRVDRSDSRALADRVTTEDSSAASSALSAAQTSSNYLTLESRLQRVQNGEVEQWDLLPYKFKERVYFFLWIADGCPNEAHYGELTLKKDGFTRLNQNFPPMFSSNGGTLFQQLIIFTKLLDKCVSSRKVSVNLAKIRSAISENKSKEVILSFFDKLPPSDKEYLRYHVYLADGRDESLKTPGFGNRRIIEDPDVMLPHLALFEAIKESVFQEKIRKLAKDYTRSITEVLESQMLTNRSIASYCAALPRALKPKVLMRHGIHVNGPLYTRIGAHFVGDREVRFSLYAPGAKKVCIETEYHGEALTRNGSFFEIVIPDMKEGDFYQYYVTSGYGDLEKTVIKQDPFAFGVQRAHESRGVVRRLDFDWTDRDWMAKRAETSFEDSPMNIFQVHLGSFMRKPNGDYLNYREFAPVLHRLCQEKKFTHVQFLPLNATKFDDSWGYQGCNGMAPNARFGTIQDLQYLINYLHNKGIGVGFDTVPFHFDRDEAFLKEIGGTPFYAKGTKEVDLSMWETYVFDFTNEEVKAYLISKIDFLARVLHADVIRVDAIWDIRKEDGGLTFIQEMTAYMKEHHPNVILVAEDDDKEIVVGSVSEGKLGFDMQWDTLFWDHIIEKIQTDEINYHGIIWDLENVLSTRKQLVISHDIIGHKGNSLERFGEDPFRKLQLMLSLFHGYPGKKLQFMTLFDWDSNEALDENSSDQKKINKLSNHLNALYLERGGSLDFEEFKWVHRSDKTNSVIAFMSQSEGSARIYIYNFSRGYLENYEMPFEDFSGAITSASEIFNTDSEEFGGEGRVNEEISLLSSKKGLKFNMPPRGSCFIDVEMT